MATKKGRWCGLQEEQKQQNTLETSIWNASNPYWELRAYYKRETSFSTHALLHVFDGID